MTINRTDLREAMAVGASRYREALAVLNRVGSAGFTQTGGMCAALEVRLERGYLLVTDAEGDLPWNPDQLRGWGVGFYRTDDVCEGPEVFVDGDDVSPAALPVLIERCLGEVASKERSWHWTT